MARKRGRSARDRAPERLVPAEIRALRRLLPGDLSLANEPNPAQPLELTRRDLARIGLALLCEGTPSTSAGGRVGEETALEALAGLADDLQPSREQVFDLATSITLLGRGRDADAATSDAFQWVAAVLVTSETPLEPKVLTNDIQRAASLATRCVRGDSEGIRRFACAREGEGRIADVLGGPLGVLLTAPSLDALLALPGLAALDDERAIAVDVLRARREPFVGAADDLCYHVRFAGSDAQALTFAEVIVETLERYAGWAASVRRGPLLPATYDDRFDARAYQAAADRCRLDVARILISLGRPSDEVSAVLDAVREPSLVNAVGLHRILASMGIPTVDHLAVPDEPDRRDEFLCLLRNHEGPLEALRARVEHDVTRHRRGTFLARDLAVLRAFVFFAGGECRAAADLVEVAATLSDDLLPQSARWLLALCRLELVHRDEGATIDLIEQESLRREAVAAMLRALESGCRPGTARLDELATRLGCDCEEIRTRAAALTKHCETAAAAGNLSTLVLEDDGSDEAMDAALDAAMDADAAVAEETVRLFANIVDDAYAASLASRVEDLLLDPAASDAWRTPPVPAAANDAELADARLEGWIALYAARDVIRRVDALKTEAAREAHGIASQMRIDEAGRGDEAARLERDARRRARRLPIVREHQASDDAIDVPDLEPLEREEFEELLDRMRSIPDPRTAVEISERLAVARSDDSLDEAWDQSLCTDGLARAVLGDRDADVERIRVLVRLDRGVDACDVAQRLFWQAINSGYSDADDFAALAEELGAPADELERMGAQLRVGSDTESRLRRPDAAITVLFVGGNETQARYQSPLDADFAARFDGRVTVRWFTTGWSSNWKVESNRVEAAYAKADAVVLMRYMRTNLGQRLRRTAGEAGLPWVPCSGHGRDSLRRAIEHAVVVASV